jgi:hypothetical protein
VEQLEAALRLAFDDGVERIEPATYRSPIWLCRKKDNIYAVFTPNRFLIARIMALIMSAKASDIVGVLCAVTLIRAHFVARLALLGYITCRCIKSVDLNDTYKVCASCLNITWSSWDIRERC